MRVLHLFSNKRWTGPAEPATNLAAGLDAAGMDVTFACSAAGDQQPHRMAAEARDRGLSVRTDLQLPKHLHPLALLHDRAALADDLRAGRYDILHCHQPVDHSTAGLARRRARVAVPIVRSVYDGAHLNGSWLNTYAVTHWTDSLCVPSAQLRDAVRAGALLPEEKVHVVDGAVDTSRFTPTRPLPDLRVDWGYGAEHRVFGVVARMQPYRRFDVLLPAFRDATRAAPNVRLVLIGRGTREEEVARQPVRQLGIGNHVHFAGYLEGDTYVGALAALDALIYLVPGSDGTCRTVREALAMGVPVLASQRGILPWLVEDGETGVVIDDTSANLSAAITRLATQDGHRQTLRANARRLGPERFALQRQVEAVAALYEALAHA